VKRFACEFAYAQFWSREVLEYGYWAVETFADLSNRSDDANVLIVGSMGEVDACNIHSRLDQLS
jgi:hypothetical protein